MLFSVLLLITTTACQPPTPTLTIAAAASLRYLAEDLIADYEEQTGRSCELVIGSTGKLSAQIVAGAPYDILLSADARYPQKLAAEGKIVGPINTFNHSGLVLWTLDSLAPLNLDSLASIDRLVIANPRTAPFGLLADSLLRLRSDYITNIAPKIVFGESIAQVNQFVTTGAVRYGLTADIVMRYGAVKEMGYWKNFGDNRIPQTVVVLKGSSIEAAEAFKAYLLTVNLNN